MSEHEWFIERIEDAITGSLPESDRARFDAHKSDCESCSREFAAMQKLENHMSSLFATVQPGSMFENNVIARFRESAPRLRINPMVLRAAGATAAAIVLATVGYFASERFARGTMPLWGDRYATQRTANLQADLGEDGQTVLYGGHGEFQQNPFAGAQRDNILARANWRFARKGDEGRKEQAFHGGAQLGQDRYRSIAAGGAPEDLEKNAPSATPTAGEAGDQAKLPGNMGMAVETQLGRRLLETTRGEWKETRRNAAYKDESAQKRDVDRAGVAGGQEEANKKLPELMRVEVESAAAPAPTGTLSSALYFQPNAQPADAVGRVLRVEPGQQAAGTAGVALDALRRDDVALGEKLGVVLKEAEAARATEPANQAPMSGEGKPPAPTEGAPVTTPEPVVAAQPPVVAQIQRKVIRNGDVEFEVESFDHALVTVSKIVMEEGGVIATTNSEKLPNGKVKGTITLRVAPERLDTLVMKLRGLGDLKRQNLTAQDITKEYYDISSDLRAARAVQDRLIEIIKTGQGQIKDLLNVEKELATWRGKIEKLEGEIRYYDSLVALSTLNISLYEKDVRSAGVTKQSEVVDMGVESEDVEKSRADAIAAIEDAKGRIIESELKKFEAGQFAAKIVADVSPDDTGAVIDRLKQLGKVARLDIQRKQTTPDNSPPLPGAKVEKGDTRIVASFYNLANVQPRQTVNLNLACDDVEKSYQTILAAIEKAQGRVVSSNLNREKPNQTTGTIQFEVKAADAEAALLSTRANGETMRLVVTENPDTANVTTAKRGFAVQLFSTATVPPRETASINAASLDVPAAHRALLDAVNAAGARVMSADLNETDRQNVSGNVDIEIRREKLEEINKVLTGPATIVARTVQRSSDVENTLDTKVRLQIKLIGADQLPARQVASMGIEVGRVDDAVDTLLKLTSDAGGKVLDSTRSTDGSGQTVARVVVEVPLAKFDEALIKSKQLGKVRVEQQSKNAQVPEINLSRGRLEVTLANAEAIVTGDTGVWGSIKKGLGTSFGGLMWSLQLIVIGVCLVAPWALILWGGWKLWKRSRPNPA